MSKILDTYGDKAPVAETDDAQTAVTGGFQDLVRKLNGDVRAAVASQKVALAIPPTTVAKGDTVTIELQPQVDFKGERLVVSDSGSTLNGTATFFTVDSIKVGRDEQLIASGGIASQVFSQTTQRSIGLNMKTCPTSLKIYITVTNVDAAASHVFGGMLIGSCGGCNEDSCGVPVPGGATFEPLVALAIPPTNVAKGASTTIEVTVEEVFRGQQLIIPTAWHDATNSKGASEVSDVSALFTVDSIKVGRDEQMLSTGELPASVFAINSQQEIGLSMKPCPTSLKIYVTVTNLDAANPHEFTGAFYGFCGANGNCNTGYCGDLDIGAYPVAPAGGGDVTKMGIVGPYRALRPTSDIR